MSWIGGVDFRCEQVRITAQAIVNAVEPFVVWSSIYSRMTCDAGEGKVGEVCTSEAPVHFLLMGGDHSSFQILEVLEWILKSFPMTDREVSSVHAPLMLSYLVMWLNVSVINSLVNALVLFATFSVYLGGNRIRKRRCFRPHRSIQSVIFSRC